MKWRYILISLGALVLAIGTAVWALDSRSARQIATGVAVDVRLLLARLDVHLPGREAVLILRVSFDASGLRVSGPTHAQE